MGFLANVVMDSHERGLEKTVEQLFSAAAPLFKGKHEGPNAAPLASKI
jgi:hypothetical protein